MQPNPSERPRMRRRAAILCAAIVAIAAAATVGWRFNNHPAELPSASCGTAITHFLDRHTHVLQADNGALTCFVTAVQKCRSASIGVTEMGVDTGTDYVFTVEPGTTPCQVTERSQYYSANFGGSKSAVSTVTCDKTAVTTGGVKLHCGHRDVLIPAKVTGIA